MAPAIPKEKLFTLRLNSVILRCTETDETISDEFELEIMKAVLSPVPEHILRWRKRTGADRHDEMWEGVLHMGAMPTKGHENFSSTCSPTCDGTGRSARVKCAP
jgi:hypothetical protein